MAKKERTFFYANVLKKLNEEFKKNGTKTKAKNVPVNIGSEKTKQKKNTKKEHQTYWRNRIGGKWLMESVDFIRWHSKLKQTNDRSTDARC